MPEICNPVVKENPICFKSGIEGLDILLNNGFILPKSGDGLILLIKGKPGTGKSTLSLKVAKSVYDELTIYETDHNERRFKDYVDWAFFTCEQKKQDIIAKSETFDFKINEKNVFDNSESPAFDSQQNMSNTTLMWASNLMYKTFIDAESENPKKKVVVIDGLNLMGTEERTCMNMDWLINALRKFTLFSILVYEPLDGESSKIDSMVDMIFQLKGEELNGPPLYFLNQIWIEKSRFQRCVLGWHQYKIISDKGLFVFPSIHHFIRKSNFFKRENEYSQKDWLTCRNEDESNNHNGNGQNNETGEDSSILTQLLKGHLNSGSFTVLLGPRKTCKTLLSIDFLKAGSRKGERGLLISLIDNRETIIKTAVHCIKEDAKHQYSDKDTIEQKSCENNYLFHFRPGCITSNEFFNNLHMQRKALMPKRVVIWDLPQIDFCYPLISNDTMFFPALIDYLKNSKIDEQERQLNERSDVASVIMGSFYCKLAKSAFTMADNVILLLRRKKDNEDSIYAYVDRIEGQPGVHYLWRVPVHNSEDSASTFFGAPEELDESEELTGKILKEFEEVMLNIERD